VARALGTRDFAFYDDALLVGAGENVGQASRLSLSGDDPANGGRVEGLSRPGRDAAQGGQAEGPSEPGLDLARGGQAGRLSHFGGAARFFDLAAESGLGLRFHAPNGLHYGPIGPALAGRMRRGGLETVRLSLESSDPERLAAWGRAGDNSAFRRAVGALREAGYTRRQVGAYILVGLPGQTPDEVRRAIELARDAGAMPKLNEYSPFRERASGPARWR